MYTDYLIRKPVQFCDLKTRQIKRASEVTKNALMREMIGTCVNNTLKFRYVLMDSWFGSVENFDFIKKLTRVETPSFSAVSDEGATRCEGIQTPSNSVYYRP